MLIDLERAAIDSPGKINPFLSSLNLVIMGREVIVIRFYNQPKFSYSCKVYNYQSERREYYNNLITKLGLDNTTTKSSTNETEIVFSEQLTDTELAYCNFRIAYENIFLDTGEDLVFEGERVMAQRGAEQFSGLVEKWRKHAKIDLVFSRPFSEMMKFFV